MMVDWADELGLDLASLHLEAFWHPVAQWENDRIRQQGEAIVNKTGKIYNNIEIAINYSPHYTCNK